MSAGKFLFTVLPCVAVCCCVLSCVAVCCSVLQRLFWWSGSMSLGKFFPSVLQ